MLPYLTGSANTALLDRLVEENRQTDAALAKAQPDSRVCVCGRTAWVDEQGPEGLRLFMCAHGHLLIVTPERAR